MNRKFFGNDPTFGKRKTFDAQDLERKNAPHTAALESQYTMKPTRTVTGDVYQGTSSLVTQADFYSNPNKEEHVKSFPSKKKEVYENKLEGVLLMIIIGSLTIASILKHST